MKHIRIIQLLASKAAGDKKINMQQQQQLFLFFFQEVILTHAYFVGTYDVA